MKRENLKKAESLGSVNTRVILKDKNEGITLVSLVTTIIILLILAGVTLALISGSDGILGRATHAVDENKKAMAKEQVELAVGDFQTEFFDAKYVERTNDGEKKEYISDKLMAGVETTDFYAVATEDGIVNVYDLGKIEKGKEVVIGAIEKEGAINWDGKGGSENHITLTEEELNSKIDLAVQKKFLNLYKAGTVSFGTITNNSAKIAEVKFDTPFENSNYSVMLTHTSNVYAYNWVTYCVMNKTQNGFKIYAWNDYSAATGNSITADWFAIPYNN